MIRHQKPPIVPDFVHTLKEKQFSLEEINTFDDEVPYARGVSSPNTPQRKRQTSSPCPSPRATSSAVAISTSIVGEPSSPQTTSPQPQFSKGERIADDTLDFAATSTTNFPIVLAETTQPEDSGEPHTRSEGVDAAEAEVTVPNFDYAGGSKPGYWSSTESSRTLHQKLSEMRLASPEEKEEELMDSQCE